jgi:hypothetical protein
LKQKRKTVINAEEDVEKLEPLSHTVGGIVKHCRYLNSFGKFLKVLDRVVI